MPPFSTVSPKDLMTLKNCSYNTARRELQHLRDALGVPDVQARHLAAYWECTVQELGAALLLRLTK
jgi:hypothetical protein